MSKAFRIGLKVTFEAAMIAFTVAALIILAGLAIGVI